MQYKQNKRIYNMKIWLDDLRKPPQGYIWCQSVNQAINTIMNYGIPEVIDFDHDAGDFACDGGDFIRLMDWMEESSIACKIKIHTMNPVGRQQMIAIAKKNNWMIIN